MVPFYAWVIPQGPLIYKYNLQDLSPYFTVFSFLLDLHVGTSVYVHVLYSVHGFAILIL